MNKDKRWLSNEITNLAGSAFFREENEPVVNVIELRNLVEQLDEPKLPVIPRVAADVLKEYKDNKYKTLYGLFFDVEREMITGEFGDWFVTDGNYEVFCRAWLDGYTVEKETMYYVIFLESEDKEKGQALYKDFNFNSDKVVSTHIETFSKRISLEAGNFHFTEQEIKSIDERYLAFKVEVSK